MSKSVFKPINDAHAIVEAAIFCEFERPFSDKILKELDDVRHLLRGELPEHTPIRVVEMIGSSSAPDMPFVPSIIDKTEGMELKKFSSADINDRNRKLEWLLRTFRKGVSVHCLNYGRWKEYSETSLRYFSTCFKKVENNALKSIVLKYIDRFSYEAELQNYSASGLFREDSKYLSPNSFECGERWHSHIGWFQEPRDNVSYEILNQLNVDASSSVENGVPKHYTTIDHTVILRPKAGQASASLPIPLDVASSEATSFSSNINELHEINKKVMIGLLSSDMCKRMSLQG